MTENKPDILDLLINHELAIKKLYELYASVFPEKRDFWLKIAGEEGRHSEWIRALRSKIRLESWLASDLQVTPQAVKSSIAHAEAQHAKTRDVKFTALKALAVARDIESALVEKHLKRLLPSTPSSIASVITRLISETEKHRNAIIEALEAEKKKARVRQLKN